MRRFGVTTAMCISLLSAGGAGWCWQRAEDLRTQAGGLLERSQLQATEYVETFNDAMATLELETLARRRAVLWRAHEWERGRDLGVMVAAVAAAIAWLLSIRRRMEGQLEEVGRKVEPRPEQVPLRAVVRPSRS
jgi:hypothetical protein